MQQIATFELPNWIERYGATAIHNLGGSAAPSLSINDLIALSSDEQATRKNFQRVNSMKLGYGVAEGEHESRDAVAALYAQPQARTSAIVRDNILMTNGASGANQLILQALISPKDHVICVYPTYGQLYEVPRAGGAELSLWLLRPEGGWHLDIEDLKSLIRSGRDGKPKTKMIIINNPSNPTGTYYDNTLQRQIIEIAKQHDIIVFSDEVFRPVFHAESANEQSVKSILDHHDIDYDNVITSGSMSKAYGLAGTRTGWVATRSSKLLEACARLRAYSIAYTTPMVEIVVAEALGPRCRSTILAKNHDRAKQCIDILEQFVQRNKSQVFWPGRPNSSSTTLVRFLTDDGKPVDDIRFSIALHESKGVLCAPASICFCSEASGTTRVFDEKDGIREGSMMGYVRCHTLRDPESMEDAVRLMEEFIRSPEYREIPPAPGAAGHHTNGITNGSS